MKHSRQEKIEALGRVIDTLDRLRVECPWDQADQRIVAYKYDRGGL